MESNFEPLNKLSDTRNIPPEWKKIFQRPQSYATETTSSETRNIPPEWKKLFQPHAMLRLN